MLPPASSVPGLLLLGWLSDRWPLRIVISLSSFGSALACLFIWGFATNVGALAAFVIVFGALGLRYARSLLLRSKLTPCRAASLRFGLA